MVSASSFSRGSTTVTFSQPSSALPIVLEFYPSGWTNATVYAVVLRFNKDMNNAAFANPNNFEVLKNGSTAVSGTRFYYPSNYTAAFIPTTPIDTTNDYYKVFLSGSGIADTSNNRLDGNYNGIEDGSPNDDFVFYFGNLPDSTPPSFSCSITSPSPNPFSPEGDNYNDFTSISGSTGESSGLYQVFFRNKDGDIIRVVMGRIGSQDIILFWNGKNEWGKVQPNGEYFWSARVFDAWSNPSPFCSIIPSIINSVLNPGDFQ
jgi:hypothetical protein